MQNKVRNVVSVLLAFALLFGVFPAIPVLAAEPEQSDYTQAPQDLRVPTLAYDESSIVVMWDKPDDYYESRVPIVDYEVFVDGVSQGLASDNFADQYSYVNTYYDAFYESTKEFDHHKVTILSFTATGLEAEREYTFAVRAVYGDDTVSAMSEPLTAGTTSAPYVVDAADYGAEYLTDVSGDWKRAGLGTSPDPEKVALIEANTAALQAAIDATPLGGKVVLKGSGDNAAPWYYVSGSIFLHSEMTFEIEEGAVLFGSPRADDYPRNLLVYPYSQDIRTMGLINAVSHDLFTLKNIRIVGKGAVDGNGCTQQANQNQQILDPKADIYEAVSDITGNNWRLRQYSSNGVASSDATSKSNASNDNPRSSAVNNTRPNLTVARGVENLYYGGVIYYNPAFHGIVNYQSDNIVANGVIAMMYNAGNGDGIEFGDCRGITVMNSFWDTGDDAINFAAGQGTVMRNRSEINATGHATAEGEGYGKVVNNFVRNSHGGLLALGSHTAGWLGNMMAEENVYNGSESGTNGALRIKSGTTNSGGVRNIIFRDTAIHHSVNPGSSSGTIRIENSYTDGGASTSWAYESDFPLTFTNVNVRNITQTGVSTRPFMVLPSPAGSTVGMKTDVSNFRVEDVRIFQRGSGSAAGEIQTNDLTNGYFKNINTPVRVAATAKNLTVIDCGLDLTQNSVPESLVWPESAALASTVNGNEVQLSWPTVPNADSYAIYVDILDDDGYHGYELMKTVTGTTDSFKLMADNTYNVAVRPEKAAGTDVSAAFGEMLETGVVTGAGTADTVIEMPANTATRASGAVGSSWQSITWAMPSIDGVTPDRNNDGYQKLQYMEIEATPVEGPTLTYRAYIETAARTGYGLWGLEDGMTYSVRLRAVAWDGAASDWYDALTLTTVPSTLMDLPQWDSDAALVVETPALRVGDPLVISWDESDVTDYAGKVYDQAEPNVQMSRFAGYRVMINGVPIQPAEAGVWPADPSNAVATVGAGVSSFTIDTGKMIPGIPYTISVEAGDELLLYATTATGQSGYTGAASFQGRRNTELKRNQVTMGKWTGHGPSVEVTLLPNVISTVTFDYNGGEGPVETKDVYTDEAYGELPAPAARESYLFLGWSTDGTEDGIVTAETIVSGSHTLTALWEEDMSDGKIRVKLDGAAALTTEDDGEYTLSAANLNKLATATVWFEVDGDYFEGRTVKGLNGFDVLGGIVWENTGGSLWSGRVTLTNMTGGVSSDSYLELLKLTLGAKEVLGDTAVKITRIDLSGYDGDNKAVYFESILRKGEVETSVVQYFSPYDVNRDGKIDQLDLTTAQLYYAAKNGDSDWDEAKIADVNGDGRVDIEDFILILNNIVW